MINKSHAKVNPTPTTHAKKHAIKPKTTTNNGANRAGDYKNEADVSNKSKANSVSSDSSKILEESATNVENISAGDNTNEQTDTIDQTSEPATQVIKRFESKISETSKKTSIKQSKAKVENTSVVSSSKDSKATNSVKRSQSLKIANSKETFYSNGIVARNNKSAAKSVASSGKGGITNNLHSNSNGYSKTNTKKQPTDMDVKGKGSNGNTR